MHFNLIFENWDQVEVAQKLSKYAKLVSADLGNLHNGHNNHHHHPFRDTTDHYLLFILPQIKANMSTRTRRCHMKNKGNAHVHFCLPLVSDKKN
jgi:hypothetical protein